MLPIFALMTASSAAKFLSFHCHNHPTQKLNVPGDLLLSSGPMYGYAGEQRDARMGPVSFSSVGNLLIFLRKFWIALAWLRSLPDPAISRNC
jgi:hypothetical protein